VTDLLRTIAMLCQLNSGSTDLYNLEMLRNNCQKELLVCSKGDVNNLANCIRESIRERE